MRTVLIGMNNPLSRNPEHALWPAPPNCAGWRLWKMLDDRVPTDPLDYTSGFERINLCGKAHWDRTAARRRAAKMLHELQGRTVIVLGAAVRDAFRLPPVLVKPVVDRGVTWRQLPHPSGRCRWYNDPRHRKIAGLLLEEELVRGREA